MKFAAYSETIGTRGVTIPVRKKNRKSENLLDIL